jgi:hypothetical protein
VTARKEKAAAVSAQPPQSADAAVVHERGGASCTDLLRSQFEWDKERLKAFALKVADVAIEGGDRPWSEAEGEIDELCRVTAEPNLETK